MTCPHCGRRLTEAALGKPRRIYIDGRFREFRVHTPAECQGRIGVEDIERLLRRGIIRATA